MTLRRSAPPVALALLATLAFAASARADVGAATVTMKVDSHAPAGSPGNSATTPDIVTSGRLYAVTVSGTYAPESDAQWSAATSTLCGTPEPAPAEASPGQASRPAGHDAFSRFATAVANHGPCPALPSQNQQFQLDLHTGDQYVLTPMNVPANSFAPRADHTYVYVVRGQGQPLTALLGDTDPSDDDGVLTVGVRLATAEDCYGNADCLAMYAQSGAGAGGGPGPSQTTTTGSTTGAATCSKRPAHGLVVRFRRSATFVSATLLVKGKHAKRLRIARRDRHRGTIRVRRLPKTAFTVVVRGRRHGGKRVVVLARRRVLAACPKA